LWYDIIESEEMKTFIVLLFFQVSFSQMNDVDPLFCYSVWCINEAREFLQMEPVDEFKYIEIVTFPHREREKEKMLDKLLSFQMLFIDGHKLGRELCESEYCIEDVLKFLNIDYVDDDVYLAMEKYGEIEVADIEFKSITKVNGSHLIGESIFESFINK